jgi:hypothetical protein
LIIDALKSLLGKDSFMPYNDSLAGKEVNKNNFTIINEKNSCNIVCIDGGCATIADGGSWIIAKIKVGIVEYAGLKKIKQESKEYYLIIVAKDCYELLVYQNNKSYELKLKGIDSIKIEELASKIMKYFEWSACLELKNDCLILMDSALNAETDFEKELVKKALDNKLKIVGFCKTSRMRTLSGRSLLGLINSISPNNSEWFYHPIFEDEKLIKTFAAKLGKTSKFCYKVELPMYLDHSIIFKSLSFFSKDSEMPGYPYPLFKADKIARINSFELKKDLFTIEKELKKSDLFFDSLSNSFHSKMDEKMYKK